MKRLAVVAAIILVAVLGFLLWQRIDVDSRTFRLKATATILVDGVERTGSSVQEYHLAWNILGRAWRLLVRGEAIRIDVPGEEPIYVLISPNAVFNNCATRNKGQDEVKTSLLQVARCEVRETYPTAVRFDGTGNYQEAIPIHIGGKGVNGYQFVGMTFERTRDPVTEGTMPARLWIDPRMVVQVPWGEFTNLLGGVDFKAEKFR